MLAWLHRHRRHVRRLPRGKILCAMLHVDGQLVLMVKLRKGMRRVGRGIDGARDRVSLYVLGVSHVHRRVGLLVLRIGLAPSWSGLIGWAKGTVLLPSRSMILHSRLLFLFQEGQDIALLRVHVLGLTPDQLSRRKG